MHVNKCLPKGADYLDTTDSFMGLGHANRLGWIFIRQHLSAAKIVSSKDDPINKIFWLTGTWDFAKQNRELLLYNAVISHIKNYKM